MLKNFAPSIFCRWRSILAGAAALAILLGALAFTPRIADAQYGVSFTFINQSRYTINNLYMSSSRIRSWGPDRLGSNVLPPGQSYTVGGLRPGNYDIKFIDQDNDTCTRMRVPVYRSTSWAISNSFLLRCEGYGRRR